MGDERTDRVCALLSCMTCVDCVVSRTMLLPSFTMDRQIDVLYVRMCVYMVVCGRNLI